jgi:hypothetical protein
MQMIASRFPSASPCASAFVCGETVLEATLLEPFRLDAVLLEPSHLEPSLLTVALNPNLAPSKHVIGVHAALF